MMGFIYNQKKPDFHSVTDAVLAAAAKYGLESMKVMYERALYRVLFVENAAHTLFLDDLYSNIEQLQIQVLGFIIAHASDISEI